MPVPDFEAYVTKHPKWEEELRALREVIRSTSLEETIKWGSPVYTFNNKNVVGLVAFKNHCALWFYQGALLREHTSLLQNAQEGKTKGMRQIRFKKGHDLPLEVLRAYVLEALQNEKEGKRIRPAGPKKLILPSELQQELEKDSGLKKAFEKLTPGKQREYANHISEAKRETTRQARMLKCVPLIRSGAGLHDRYRS